ncbi:sensor histidine kinase [Euzebya tangerina]|uniref:sensor histidine kinase n=1 Tax=Euzebya tangerina TaxID=591198 RepID=UPI0013C3345A|nr:histidine kinase [Euzebya tangerina]
MSDHDAPPVPEDERRPGVPDLIIVGLMLLFGSLSIFLHQTSEESADFVPRLPAWGNYLSLVLLVIPVAFRRMAPAAICLGVGVGFAVFRILEVPEGLASSVAVFLVIHAAGAYVAQARTRNLVRAAALIAGAVAYVRSVAAEIEFVSVDLVLGLSLGIGINIAFYVAAWLLGDGTRRRRVDAEELARRAALLQAEQAKTAQQAVTEERVRISRELHDVVAHHVSVMGIQAGAARRVMERNPGMAQEALEQVERSGRQAIDELHRLVGFLRSSGDSTGEVVDAPQPTLAGLEDLVEAGTAAGLTVDLRRIGRVGSVPDSVELSAFRIVQEALTNVMKHAPGSRVTVVVSSLADAVQIEVVNGPSDGTAPPRARTAAGGGRGVVGMRERAVLLGGSFTAGPHRGGFRVRARLPIPDADAGRRARVGSSTSGAP